MTVREIAPLVGAGRESTGRVLSQLEAVGWVRREHGEAARGLPDVWSADRGALAAWVGGSEDAARHDRANGELVCGQDVEARGVSLPVLEPLQAGGLQQLVLGVLEASAGVELGPVQVARLLGGRSQGAVANCLERLVVAGLVVRTCEAPRRYRAVRREARADS